MILIGAREKESERDRDEGERERGKQRRKGLLFSFYGISTKVSSLRGEISIDYGNRCLGVNARK